MVLLTPPTVASVSFSFRHWPTPRAAPPAPAKSCSTSLSATTEREKGAGSSPAAAAPAATGGAVSKEEAVVAGLLRSAMGVSGMVATAEQVKAAVAVWDALWSCRTTAVVLCGPPGVGERRPSMLRALRCSGGCVKLPFSSSFQYLLCVWAQRVSWTRERVCRVRCWHCGCCHHAVTPQLSLTPTPVSAATAAAAAADMPSPPLHRPLGVTRARTHSRQERPAALADAHVALRQQQHGASPGHGSRQGAPR
jgi:hypothetical protein